jgi:hypothetical protein
MPLSQNVRFIGTAPGGTTSEHLGSEEAIANSLKAGLENAGWSAGEFDIWRDCGWMLVVSKGNEKSQVIVAGTGIESEWILQIAPANVPTLISTWFGRKPSASPHATFALAVEVHRLLSAQGFRDFRWEWDGWAIHGSPEPVAPDSTR